MMNFRTAFSLLEVDLSFQKKSTGYQKEVRHEKTSD